MALKKCKELNKLQQKQYLLDSLTTCCSKETDWKDAKFQFLVQSSTLNRIALKRILHLIAYCCHGQNYFYIFQYDSLRLIE